jgi:RNA polymerase sigma-70 factor (ECF subfamily)
MSPDEEAQVIEAAKCNPKEFAQLYRAYVRPIYRYVFSRLGNSVDAEDLTSQIFIEALKDLPRYHHHGYFLAWLFSIARHRLLNFQQRHPPEANLELLDEQESPITDPLSQVIQGEERRSLLRSIRTLKEEEQDLLRLRFVADLSYAEIGLLLGRSEDAIKKQTYRLLARLENQIEASYEHS